MEVHHHSQLKNKIASKMKHNITVVFALLSCVTATAQFNEAAKTQLIKEWQRAKVYTLEYLEGMPKDKYGFKAKDSVRSLMVNIHGLIQIN